MGRSYWRRATVRPCPASPWPTDDVLAFHETLSNWGRWGDDDQLGALNLITPDVTAAAAATVRTGRTRLVRPAARHRGRRRTTRPRWPTT